VERSSDPWARDSRDRGVQEDVIGTVEAAASEAEAGTKGEAEDEVARAFPP